MSVLVVAAHPDDEVLGCGGTIARLAEEGYPVYIAVLGEGITSRHSQRGDADLDMVAALESCSRRVAMLLGAKDVFVHRLPDNRFDTVPLLDVVKIVERLIEDLKPQVIYAHHGGDLNIDHAVAFRAVLTATRPLQGCSVKELYVYEVPSATEWAFAQWAPSFHPNVFVDINPTLEKKVEAMQIYESEARTFPHPRSAEALRALAQLRGSTVGLEAAEAFELIRSVRVLPLS